VREAYERMDRRASVHPFLGESTGATSMGAAYALADLVICRGGASSVAECLALGKPAVFVPYPWHRDGHQARNAQAAARSGAAVVVEQDELDVPRVKSLLNRFLLEQDQRDRMADLAASMGRPAAARSMASHLFESLGDALAEPQLTVELGG